MRDIIVSMKSKRLEESYDDCGPDYLIAVCFKRKYNELRYMTQEQRKSYSDLFMINLKYYARENQNLLSSKSKFIYISIPKENRITSATLIYIWSAIWWSKVQNEIWDFVHHPIVRKFHDSLQSFSNRDDWNNQLNKTHSLGREIYSSSDFSFSEHVIHSLSNHDVIREIIRNADKYYQNDVNCYNRIDMCGDLIAWLHSPSLQAYTKFAATVSNKAYATMHIPYIISIPQEQRLLTFLWMKYQLLHGIIVKVIYGFEDALDTWSFDAMASRSVYLRTHLYEDDSYWEMEWKSTSRISDSISWANEDSNTLIIKNFGNLFDKSTLDILNLGHFQVSELKYCGYPKMLLPKKKWHDSIVDKTYLSSQPIYSMY